MSKKKSLSNAGQSLLERLFTPFDFVIRCADKFVEACDDTTTELKTGLQKRKKASRKVTRKWRKAAETHKWIGRVERWARRIFYVAIGVVSDWLFI
ncbi:hypothetical protein [Glycomyces tritici]|uniref:Transposase n=1 Tax=Glycomyces tritici TaxID=2665176 RepID=A0ABT7YUY6_9ACTN|nr:hypothetical protein [Glycomyces tritici]MDN3242437.1 hypothetical protein [Glycomyces tritici]